MNQEVPRFSHTPIRRANIIIRSELQDPYGHTNYLGFNVLFERQRDAYMNARGLGLDVLESEYGLRVNIPDDETKRREHLRVGDEVTIFTAVEASSRALKFHQIMDHGKGRFTRYTINAVLVDTKTGKIPRLPDEVA